MTKQRNTQSVSGHFHGSGQYTRQIVKCLEKVNAMSEYRPATVFDDWSQLVEACLEALPDHLTSIAQTGQLADDTPETKECFQRIRSRYRPQPYQSSNSWQYFSQALAILLESAAPGR